MSDQKKIHDFAPRTLGAGFVHKKDLVLAIILVAFGAFMYYEASKFPEAPAILGDTLNADVYPKMLITIMFLLVAIIPFEFKLTPEKVAKIDKDRDDKTLTINENKIVKGSRIINSNIERNECCNSRTSDEILAIKSPFFFSVKKFRGREIVLL